MKTNLRLGRLLLEEGYNLRSIAEMLIGSIHSAVFHSVKNRQIFSHEELEKRKLIDRVETISYQTDNIPFFFIVHPSVFEYFHIKINSTELIPKDSKVYSKEKVQELTHYRRAKAHAMRYNVLDTSILIKQGKAFREKIHHVCRSEESGELVYFFCDRSFQPGRSVNIYFSFRSGIEKYKISEDYLLKFNICPRIRVLDYINQLKRNVDMYEDGEIINQICNNSTCYRSNIVFKKCGNDHFAEAQCLDFRNEYILSNGNHIWLFREHSGFKCIDNDCDDYSLYNECAMFIANNAFEYFKDGKNLEFIEDYFVFDFNLYSKLYFFDNDNLAEDSFIEILSKYRYDIIELENIEKKLSVNFKEKIIEFLICFYTKIHELLLINFFEKKSKNIDICIDVYKFKLKGITNEDAWCKATQSSKNQRAGTNTSESLKNLNRFANENGLPYIDFKEVILTRGFKDEFLDDDTLKEKLVEQIKSCSDIEVKKIISELDTSFLR